MRSYAGLIRSGRRDVGIQGDTLQLGGDVVIGPTGTIAWLFRGDGPDDRPSVDALIDAVCRARLTQ